MPVASPRKSRVLLVDDEPDVTQGIQLALRKEPFEFERAQSGAEALSLLERHPFDVVVSDERMPGMAGSQLLSIVRERHPEIVRIILSGQASLEAALRAINGAEIYRFLMKPCPPEELALTIRQALRVRDDRRAVEAWEKEQRHSAPERKAQSFERLLAGLWIGFQPIVTAKSGALFGYEVLLRNDDREWHGSQRFFTAAKKLGRSQEACRRVRALVAENLAGAPADTVVSLNVSPEDLMDDDLIEGVEPLADHARRVVLEIPEQESMKSVPDLDLRVQKLRDACYRVAADDLGAGNSGLSSLVLLVPDFVKFDMDVVHGIDRSPTKQLVIGPMVEMSRGLGIQCLAEGVETLAEHETVVRLGCDLLQGHHYGPATREFARPAAA